MRRSPQVVRRCPNHASRPAPAQSGEAAAAAPPEHLLVCEHKRARYDDDPYTGRLSVVIPHEPPQGTTELDMGWVQGSFRAGTHWNAVPVLFLITGTPFRSFSAYSCKI